MAKEIDIRNLLIKYPHCVPLILTKKKSEDQKKYLIKSDNTIADLLIILRKREKLNPSESIFIFIKNNNEFILPKLSDSLGEIYEKFKNKHSLLLELIFCEENTFG